MAFQTALSGLNAAQSNLSVTGNNIANSSTTGFKKSRSEFGDIYATSFGGATATNIGAGVRLTNVSQQFSQGNIEFTENSLDLAMSGQGFFAVRDTDGTELYTRAGQFGVNREGYVVNSYGQMLQSYPVDSAGVVTSFSSSDLRLSTDTNPANATSLIDINVNLDASSAVPTAAFDHTDIATYNFSTSTTIYDSLGAAHTATLYFVKTGTGTWDSYSAITDAADGNAYFYGAGGVANDSSTAVALPVTFNASGQLTSGTLAFFDAADPFNPSTGATAINPLTVDLGTSTQYSGESTINSLVQDGYTTGRLSGIDIGDDGVVYARYTNGQSALLGAVAVANFSNPQGLTQVGNSAWAASFDSGDVVYGQANKGTFGAIQSGALEASNVDLSKQLVNMIIAQRDFQANAKMISAEDQVTQTIINIR